MKIILTSHTSLVLNNEQMMYVKKLESYAEKIKEKKSIRLSEKYDGINREQNVELYTVLGEKSENKILHKLPGNQSSIIKDGMRKFEKASLDEQVVCLLQLVALYKTGRSGGCDITCIGGAKNAGVVSLSSHISNWKKYFSDVRIIDQSASGLYESKSCNLLELL